MVYLTIPEDLTDEEKKLKEKYALLRKFQDKLKNLNQEPAPQKVVEKRSSEAKLDAKEVAKKLLKSGAISAIKRESKEKTIFKRPKGSEKKNSDRNSKTAPRYSPFSPHDSCSNDSSFPDFRSPKSSSICHTPYSTSSPHDPFPTGSPSAFPTPDFRSPKSTVSHLPPPTPNPYCSTSPPSNPAFEWHCLPGKKLYDNFVSSGTLKDEMKQDSGERHRQNRERNDTAESPREGNTVYVSGYDLATQLAYGLTREYLQKIFQNIGSIRKIYIPESKQCGFVTFKRNEFAYEAIKTINRTVSDGIRLNVYLARRQFYLPSPPPEDLSSSPKINGSDDGNVRDISEYEFA